MTTYNSWPGCAPIPVKRLHPDAKLPTYGSAGAACFDLSTVHGGEVDGSKTFRTGLAFEVPADHVMLVFSRSGHGFNHDVRLANCVGVIDSDYRGEVQVRLTADNRPYNVMQGDRIAQAMVLPVQQMVFVEVDEMGATERGTGGFGSTGVK
jgi:dUTP pyrophosphatase